jgi:hypothetical protein
VSCLVHGREEGRGEPLRIEARGDADVVRPAEVYAERVYRPVLPPAFEVEAELGRHFLAERLLPRLVEVAVQGGLPVFVQARCDLAYHRHDGALEFLEDPLHVCLARARLVQVEQGVVWMVLVAQVLGGLSLEAQDPLQVRFESRPVGLGARLGPGRFRHGRGPRQLGDEARGKLRCPVVVAADDAQDGGAVRAGFLSLGLCRLKERPRLVRGEHLVREAAQRGQLLRAARDAAGRHVRLLVPVQNRGRGTDVGYRRQSFLELRQGVLLFSILSCNSGLLPHADHVSTRRRRYFVGFGILRNEA